MLVAATHSRKPTPKELSRFYKQYLDENYHSYVEYNRFVWKENISGLPEGILYEGHLLFKGLGQLIQLLNSSLSVRGHTSLGGCAHGVTVR